MPLKTQCFSNAHDQYIAMLLKIRVKKHVSEYGILFYLFDIKKGENLAIV
jgi:hypothetical protein